MIDSKTVNELKNAPVEERLKIIELILQSLKSDLTSETGEATVRHFTVRKFSLG